MNGCECKGRRLYWADGGAHLIGWRDLDGRRTGVYFKHQGPNFMGLDIYHTELFVTDWGPDKNLANTTHIYRIGKDGTMTATVQVNGRVNDVRVYDEERTNKVSTSPAPTSDHTISESTVSTSPAPTSDHTISESTETDSDGAKTLNIILVGVIVPLVVTAGIATLIVFIKKRKCK
ncbi:uncharacterized protein LOC112556957 [Pomacea canaliculata]|uniref:uncharacterized protein LOC112556957 n=1 Tax=Pomacea canaliculata TaxID=400727 RepID=UPI000D733FA4|nr:uncharacterized protein LOC112556957 [Pomacea canaliculata]